MLYLVTFVSLALIVYIPIGCMYRPFGDSGFGDSRVPSFDPERQSTRSFETYCNDVKTWLGTVRDKDASHQACLLAGRLRGTAQDMWNSLPYDERMNGGNTPDGAFRTPVGYLLYHLTARYAPQASEVRSQTINDLMTFQRKSGESVENTMQRFERVRSKCCDKFTGAMAL